MDDKADIFDRLFATRFLRVFQPFYIKYKEQLLYLFFGGLTTVISIAVFAFFTEVIPCNELLANIFSWIIAVLFAFVTNRTWVFQNTFSQNLGTQIISFYLGRIATLLVEEAILFIFVTLMNIDAMAIKIVAQIVIIVLNYIISKMFVFKQPHKKGKKHE